jgi:hypothetical protein
VLNTISNPDGDGNYVVDWDDADLAQFYTLQESTDSNFTDAQDVYVGTLTSYSAHDQPLVEEGME